jgi:hypothetical protein
MGGARSGRRLGCRACVFELSPNDRRPDSGESDGREYGPCMEAKGLRGIDRLKERVAEFAGGAINENLPLASVNQTSVCFIDNLVCACLRFGGDNNPRLDAQSQGILDRVCIIWKGSLLVSFGPCQPSDVTLQPRCFKGR